MMGTGKTVVGRVLATRAGTRFYDLDDEVEIAVGRSIAAIFRDDGEDEFRELEAEAVARVAGSEPGVVATGGGVVLRADNVAAMRASGSVVLLVSSADTVAKRLSGLSGRPLLDGQNDPIERLAGLASERDAAYRNAADTTVGTDGRTPEEVAIEIETRCGAT